MTHKYKVTATVTKNNQPPVTLTSYRERKITKNQLLKSLSKGIVAMNESVYSNKYKPKIEIDNFNCVRV